jgi:hypothetical protein
MGWGDIAWTDVAQDMDQWTALVNMVINLRVPQNFANFLNSCTTGGFSRRAQLHGDSYVQSLVTLNLPNVTPQIWTIAVFQIFTYN